MGGQAGRMAPEMMHGMMSSGPMMRMMLAVMDTDGDGVVSLSEFQAAHERIFKAMDADKDGRLTARELQAFLEGQGETVRQMERPARGDSNTPGTQPENRQPPGPAPRNDTPGQITPPAGAQQP